MPKTFATSSAEYERGRFWPAPLIQINPNYQLDKSVQQLAASGMLHPVTGEIFRVNKDPAKGTSKSFS